MTINEQIRTLSNPVRFEILEVLKAGGQMPASEIIKDIKQPVSVPMLSQHLTKLRLTKLVIATNVGGRSQYSLNKDAVSSVLRRLEALG